ncbi:hypothetical protein E8E11_009952 [Didymella keratinophila]|nr:hypothetical protein E8E11_009952 [Didymella keratinophila]
MRRRLHVIAAAVLTVTTSILFHRHDHLPPLQQQSFASANATLGFDTILAVSRVHSRRLPRLLWAANLTDLRIEVPSQPNWTGGDLHSFRLASDSSISECSALAWLGHLHALRAFLSSDASTALILEDNAGFSLSIRSHQIPLLASKLRKLLESAGSYWPHPSTWDILYPRHCNDALSSSSNPLLSHPHTLCPDATTPPHVTLHPDTSNFLRLLCVPEKRRFLHRTLAPLCTVAYAVHRRSAELIVQRLAKEERGVQAFDVRMLRACAQG